MADLDVRHMEDEWSELGLAHQYAVDYKQKVHDKYLAHDKKVLPEMLSDGLKAEIAKKRIEAFEKASKLRPRDVYRQAREITGSDFSIPEWAIVRDEDNPFSDRTMGVHKITFPKQFFSRRETRIEKIVRACEGSTNNCLEGVSEPLLQGFNNESENLLYGLTAPLEEVTKYFFKNFLECSRFCSRRPFFAWVQAQTRRQYPIFTLINRARPLKPICQSGSAQRPFPFEIGGRTYLCEGEIAEKFFLAFPRDKVRYYAGMIVHIERKFLKVEKIIEELIALDIDALCEEPTPVKEEKPPIEQYQMEVYTSLSDEALNLLAKGGRLPESEKNLIIRYKSFWNTLPTGQNWYLIMDSDNRNTLLNEYLIKKENFRKELLLYLETTFKHFEQSGEGYVSVFDMEDEDEGGFLDFDAWGAEEEEEEEKPPSPEPEPSIPEELEPSTELDFEPSPDKTGSLITWEPRFISEVRLWPVRRQYWDPP